MKIEWPTVGLAFAIYGCWFGLTACAGDIPLPILIVAGGVVIAWHGSLQHEATHGHPTSSRAVNAAIAGAPLALWLPFGVYQTTHIEHHRTAELTDPREDPESFYLSGDAWRGAGPVRRGLSIACNTLAGRLVLGPFVVVARTAGAELCRIAAGDVGRLGIWCRHLIAAGLVMAWVVGVCGMHPLRYVGAFVYPGLSLTLLRSFAEHRPAAERAHRSAVVEAHPLWALLFLNNNLHALHHAEPRRPWYQLPARYRARRSAILAANGGYLIRGYGELARRHGLRVKDAPVHPGDDRC